MIALRRSPEGDRAAQKVADRLGEAGLECFRAVFPKGMDANDFLLKSPGGFEALLRQAEPREIVWVAHRVVRDEELHRVIPALAHAVLRISWACRPATIAPAGQRLVDAAGTSARAPRAEHGEARRWARLALPSPGDVVYPARRSAPRCSSSLRP
ncbi:MAG: hypothetical protein IT371_22975, partial [Deltaproteobacteria bacterium]|nr:hypothetical protein [Deltaproteobacteria bacterium]